MYLIIDYKIKINLIYLILKLAKLKFVNSSKHLFIYLI